jgi:hypothetical protein
MLTGRGAPVSALRLGVIEYPPAFHNALRFHQPGLNPKYIPLIVQIFLFDFVWFGLD